MNVFYQVDSLMVNPVTNMLDITGTYFNDSGTSWPGFSWSIPLNSVSSIREAVFQAFESTVLGIIAVTAQDVRYVIGVALPDEVRYAVVQSGTLI